MKKNLSVIFSLVSSSKVLVFSILFLYCFTSLAQENKRQIRIYHVIIKTKGKTVRGDLERCTPTKVFVSENNGTYTAINASEIKRIKIKEYPNKRRTIEIPVMEPRPSDYTSEGVLSKEYLASAPSLADEVAYSTVGLIMSGIYGLLYNQFNNLAVFKPKSNIKNYEIQVHELSEYAVYNQNSPQYDIELLKKGSAGL